MVLSTATGKHINFKDKVFNALITQTTSGKFELKKCNAYPAFAQAINSNFPIWMSNTENFALESYRSERMNSHQSEVFLNSSNNHLPGYWFRLIKTTNSFIPYMEYFFPKYKSSQKLVILRMLQQLSIYNNDLFCSFVEDLQKILSGKNNEEELLNRLAVVSVSKHPVTNENIDRLFEMIEVLDFHYKHHKGKTLLDKH